MIKIVRTEVTQSGPKIIVKLNRVPNDESIVFALAKKMKNNPCKIASVKYNQDDLDIIVINNLKIKRKDTGEYVVNTSKSKLRSEHLPLKTLRKYFQSPQYTIVAQPILQIIINESDVITRPISRLLDLKYKKREIKQLAIKEMNLYKSLKSINAKYDE
ncbi:hypothetical protein ACFPPD_21750 [Cohnella suwonensis]|uniref:Uncharacterized protein n=1 Tax=Cohnella suwonensis TaxID=696072 RepID=A0ABW0M3B0_9BACL